MCSYVAGNVTLNDAATWPAWERELAAGANWATKLIGLDGTTLKDERWKDAPLRATSAEGRAALARAKARIGALDFVGVVRRFDESLDLLDDTLGLRLRRCARAACAARSDL